MIAGSGEYAVRGVVFFSQFSFSFFNRAELQPICERVCLIFLVISEAGGSNIPTCPQPKKRLLIISSCHLSSSY